MRNLSVVNLSCSAINLLFVFLVCLYILLSIKVRKNERCLLRMSGCAGLTVPVFALEGYSHYVTYLKTCCSYHDAIISSLQSS